MKKLLVAAMFIGVLSEYTRACTTFLLENDGRYYFGRNYDWVTANGFIYSNQRSVYKTSMATPDGKTINWTSKYGSITFNQYGKEFPTGGMNEKGLVVELMWLDGTRYPDADERPAVGVLQWIQYQLDNSTNIEEVIATDQTLRITSSGTPLHYLVADAEGNAATVEFLDGKMVVHKGQALTFPVLTNSRYAASLSAVLESSKSASALSDNSLQRFATACNLLDQYADNPGDVRPLDFAFHVLKQVSQGTFTRWSIVYDITSRTVHFRTADFMSIKMVAFQEFDFSCHKPAKGWDMNQEGSGNIASFFTPFSAESNRALVERSAVETRSQFSFSEEAIRRLWEYPGSVTCQ